MSRVLVPPAESSTSGALAPESLLDVITEGVTVLDAEGRFTYLNTVAERVLGAPRERLLGRKVGEVYPDFRETPLGAAAQRSLTERVPLTVEAFYSSQGIWLEASMVPRESHLVVLLRDVTARRQAEEDRARLLALEQAARAEAESHVTDQLLARQELEAVAWRQRFLSEASILLAGSLDYTTTMESLARLVVPELADWCGVDMLTADGRVENLALAHPEPSRLERVREVLRLHPIDPSAECGAGKVLRTGEPEWMPDLSDPSLLARASPVMPLLWELGTRSYLCVPLVARGRVLGCLTLLQSGSGRHYAEADLRLAEELASRAALNVDNARLYQEAQEAIRLRDEFLSIASHELKTPLTSLRLQLSLLERLMSSESQERIGARLEGAHRQVDRLASLVTTLLDVSRIATGRISLELSEVDFTLAVREALERLREVFAQAGCAVTLQTQGPVVGRWDALRLDQVIVNLLTNAAKYGQGRPVTVTVEGDGERARLIVRDEGIGIAAEALPRLFGRFERAVSVRHYGGLGLGLYISRQIIEALGGWVSVDSRPGEGATFTVELPCEGPRR